MGAVPQRGFGNRIRNSVNSCSTDRHEMLAPQPRRTFLQNVRPIPVPRGVRRTAGTSA